MIFEDRFSYITVYDMIPKVHADGTSYYQYHVNDDYLGDAESVLGRPWSKFDSNFDSFKYTTQYRRREPHNVGDVPLSDEEFIKMMISGKVKYDNLKSKKFGSDISNIPGFDGMIHQSVLSGCKIVDIEGFEGFIKPKDKGEHLIIAEYELPKTFSTSQGFFNYEGIQKTKRVALTFKPYDWAIVCWGDGVRKLIGYSSSENTLYYNF